MKIRPVRAELSHAQIWTDGQTDMTKLIVAFAQFCECEKKTVGSLNGLEIFSRNQTRLSKPNLQPADLPIIVLYLPKWHYNYCPCTYFTNNELIKCLTLILPIG
jgi:hypothetical protein